MTEPLDDSEKAFIRAEAKKYKKATKRLPRLRLADSCLTCEKATPRRTSRFEMLCEIRDNSVLPTWYCSAWRRK